MIKEEKSFGCKLADQATERVIVVDRRRREKVLHDPLDLVFVERVGAEEWLILSDDQSFVIIDSAPGDDPDLIFLLGKRRLPDQVILEGRASLQLVFDIPPEAINVLHLHAHSGLLVRRKIADVGLSEQLDQGRRLLPLLPGAEIEIGIRAGLLQI